MSLDIFMVDGSNVSRAWFTLEHVMERCAGKVPFRAVHFCSDAKPVRKAKLINVHWHQAPIAYGSRRNYGVWVKNVFPTLIHTTHAMIIHRDGYPLNPGLWSDEFLKYDVIGAPWSATPPCVGNSGFCIRSQRIARWFAQQPTPDGEFPEDMLLCVTYYQKAIEAGFSFAPPALAARFSLENNIAEFPRTRNDVFGFHGAFDRLDLLL